MENLVFLATEHASHQGFNLGNMAINILAVLILLVLLKKFAWDKLIDMLDERQKLVEGQLDDAAKNQKEALNLLEENQEKLKNAQNEIKVMMEDAREQSKIEKQAILEEARKQAEQLKVNAQRDIEDEKKRALEEINRQIADLSVLVASKILEKVLANKIGYSLFEVAKENNSLKEVSYELNEVAKVINENSDFVTLMNNPNIERIKKINLIDASFVGVNKHIINVVKILADNLQISLINFVLEQFDELYSRYSNSVVVKVESASPLTEIQLENLKEKLKNELELDKVEINNLVDESLIGGLKITYNNKVVDASIKARLNALKSKISAI